LLSPVGRAVAVMATARRANRLVVNCMLAVGGLYSVLVGPGEGIELGRRRRKGAYIHFCLLISLLMMHVTKPPSGEPRVAFPPRSESLPGDDSCRRMLACIVSATLMASLPCWLS
jgi:hypothetical protein